MYTRVLFIVAALSACHGFDTSQTQIKPLSVGHEMFGVMCDRLVAQNFPEDIEGKKYQRICRPGSDGRYDALPPVPKASATNGALEKQRLAQARLEAMVRRRSELVLSFNQMFPEDEPGFLAGMKKLLADMTPLYDRELPTVAASLDGILANILASDEAVKALTRVSNREGYRPMQATAGALAAMASQPTFADMTAGVMGVLEEGGPNEVMLNQLLAGLHKSIRSSEGTGSLGATIGKVLLFEDDSLYAAGPETYVVKRDKCGFAAFAPQSRYAREESGCAPTDAFGRMLDAANRPMLLPTPFALPGRIDTVQRDEFGRVIDPEQTLPAINNTLPTLYQYTNVSKTALASLLGDSRALFQPDRPLLNDVITDLGPVLGDRATRIEQLQGLTLRTETFGAETSPAMDLAIATQPMVRALAKENFAALDALANALEKNSRTGQRIVAALVHAKNLANADTFAKYDQTSTFWDEMIDVLVEIADARDAGNNPVPLLEEMLEGMAAPEVQYLAKAKSDAFQYRDYFDIDPDDINAPAKNYSNTVRAPGVLVDRRVADGGANASMFQRLIKVIHEASNVKLCNKDGAALPGMSIGALQQAKCGLFQVDNMAAFFMQAIVVNGNTSDPLVIEKQKGVFPLRDPILGTLLKITGPIFSGTDVAVVNQILRDQSGLTGMGLVPTAEALGRMLFMTPPTDRPMTTQEAKLFSFVDHIAEAAPSAVCPLDPAINGPQCPASCLLDRTSSTCSQCTVSPLFGLRKCEAGQELRARNPGAIYLFEANNMYAALRPLLRPFVKYDKEHLFLKLISTIHRHWPSAADTACQKVGAPELNGAYCAKSGMVRYEPLLSKLFSERADLIPALRQATIDLQAEGGARKLGPMVRAFFSREDNKNFKDRAGVLTSKRNDGYDNPYLVPATLFIKALDEIDTRRKTDSVAFARYKQARSNLIDQLFAFEADDGDISTARLKSQAMTKVLPRLLRVTADQLRAKKDKGGVDAWLNGGFLADVQSTLTSPTLYAGVELLKAMRADPSVERNVLATLYGAFDPAETSAFIHTAAALVDSLQGLADNESLDPLVPLLAPAFEPTGETKVVGTTLVPGESGMLKATISLLAKTAKLDPDRRFSSVLASLVTPFPGTVGTPLEVVTSTVGEVARVDPSKRGEPYTDADTRRVLESLREFVADEETGFKRLISIIQRRTLRNLPPR